MLLYYPSLITVLCAASGVQYGPNEESLAPMSAITDSLGLVVQGSQPCQWSSSLRNLTMAEQMERL